MFSWESSAESEIVAVPSNCGKFGWFIVIKKTYNSSKPVYTLLKKNNNFQ